jgi:hypothetical protein
VTKNTVTMRSKLSGSTISVYLDSLNGKERTDARKALVALTQWSDPRIRNVELNYGGHLTCEAIVTSPRRRTEKRKQVLTMVCRVVRRAVLHYRERVAATPHQPQAVHNARHLRALASPQRPAKSKVTLIQSAA